MFDRLWRLLGASVVVVVGEIVVVVVVAEVVVVVVVVVAVIVVVVVVVADAVMVVVVLGADGATSRQRRRSRISGLLPTPTSLRRRVGFNARLARGSTTTWRTASWCCSTLRRFEPRRNLGFWSEYYCRNWRRGKRNL